MTRMVDASRRAKKGEVTMNSLVKLGRYLPKLIPLAMVGDPVSITILAGAGIAVWALSKKDTESQKAHH